MAGPRSRPAAPDGPVFGYLGVRISGGAVWTCGRGVSRQLGPLRGARAGLAEPRRSRLGWLVSSVLLGRTPPKNARLFVTFADGTRYERMPLPWVSELDWPKIGGDIGRFNAAAELPPE